jgi:ribosomal protein S18 acetylase RimI-like enzyme
MPERNETDPNAASHPAISFRRYEPGDIPACARLAEDAWPAGPALATEELGPSGMEGYMEYSRSLANWTDIAYTSEGIIGFLFGRIDNYPEKMPSEKSPFGEPSIIIRSFFRERITPTLLRFLWSLILTDLKLKLNLPKSDASIEMFIVDSKYRGRGVGSELLERFLRAARDAGSSLVTVYTDDRMSNWGFYERKGFRRVGTFYDNITSHYSGSDARGIIFTLDLKREKTLGEERRLQPR